jgi:hypothetical protein
MWTGNAHLNIAISAVVIMLQFQIKKHQFNYTAPAHRNSPETLSKVAIGLGIVGRYD